MAKTVQALKVSASWTPNDGPAGKMMAAALGQTHAAGVRFSGGRLALKHAIKIDFADPAQASRVSARVAEIKAALAAAGELHDFRTTAGAVQTADAEILPDPGTAPADEPALPDGWIVRGDGTLVVPDMVAKGKAASVETLSARGHSAVLARFRRVENASGAVLKSSNDE